MVHLCKNLDACSIAATLISITWTDRSCASHTSLIFVASISLPNSLMLCLVTSTVWHSFPRLPTTSHFMTLLSPTQSHLVETSCVFYEAPVSAAKNSTKL